jgi:pimeloyl-ACP methyl ester carboxylesterase
VSGAIATAFYPASFGVTGRVLLVMLPGVGSEAADFAARGFVTAVHDRGLPVDIIAAQPDLDLYLEGKVADALNDAVILPAMSRGYARLWLLGISLGGMGALLYAAAGAASVDGLMLLSPFLATPGTVAEVSSMGGMTTWSPQHSRAIASERDVLLWTQRFLALPPTRPALYLAYGKSDRFAPGHELVARHLPRERVAVVEGGHDWETWLALFEEILERRPFAAGGGPVA